MSVRYLGTFKDLEAAARVAGKVTLHTMGVIGFLLGIWCLKVHAGL